MSASSPQGKSWWGERCAEKGQGTGWGWVQCSGPQLPHQRCPSRSPALTMIPALSNQDGAGFLLFATTRAVMLELSSVSGKQDYSLSTSIMTVITPRLFPQLPLHALLLSHGKWRREKEKELEPGGRALVPSSPSPAFFLQALEGSSILLTGGEGPRPAADTVRAGLDGLKSPPPARATALSCPKRNLHCHPGSQPSGMGRAGVTRAARAGDMLSTTGQPTSRDTAARYTEGLRYQKRKEILEEEKVCPKGSIQERLTQGGQRGHMMSRGPSGARIPAEIEMRGKEKRQHRWQSREVGTTERPEGLLWRNREQASELLSSL